jgi:sugar phosphate isomerase/epimerase
VSRPLHFGYNTNGFAHHRLPDALRILADLGYDSVALTLDYFCLDPFAADFSSQLEATRALLEKLGLRATIETGARFLLDPRRKHQPTLIGPPGEKERRLHFLEKAVDAAQSLSAGIVSLWSGATSDAAPAEVLWDRLSGGCRALCDYAADRSVRLAFEPEPGMWIDTMARFAELRQRVAHPAFGLTLDIGHLHCLGETPIVEQCERWQALLWNIHIEDMCAGLHDHLMFGEGEIDFPPVLAKLVSLNYQGGVHVELSRHSHDAVETARRSIIFLQNSLPRQRTS